MTTGRLVAGNFSQGLTEEDDEILDLNYGGDVDVFSIVGELNDEFLL